MAKIEMKKPVIDEISANIKDAQSVVLVDYRGLTVEQDTKLRQQFREAGITYKVYKNTMMNLHSREPIANAFPIIWKDPARLPFPQRMQQRLQESFANLPRGQTSWKLKAELWKALNMMPRELQKLPKSLQGKCCFADCLAVCSHLLQTSRVLSSRLQKKTAKLLRKQPQQNKAVLCARRGMGLRKRIC